MTFIDLTNQTFGDLKVIKRDYEYGKNKGLKEWNKKTFWECQCLICNEKVIKQGSVLRKKGQAMKCSKCGRTNVKIGQKYGLLTILSNPSTIVVLPELFLPTINVVVVAMFIFPSGETTSTITPKNTIPTILKIYTILTSRYCTHNKSYAQKVHKSKS